VDEDVRPLVLVRQTRKVLCPGIERDIASVRRDKRGRRLAVPRRAVRVHADDLHLARLQVEHEDVGLLVVVAGDEIGCERRKGDVAAVRRDIGSLATAVRGATRPIARKELDYIFVGAVEVDVEDPARRLGNEVRGLGGEHNQPSVARERRTRAAPVRLTAVGGLADPPQLSRLGGNRLGGQNEGKYKRADGGSALGDVD
jgi:hypothetical protein